MPEDREREARSAAAWPAWWHGPAGETARRRWYGEDAALVQSRKSVWDEFLRWLGETSTESDRWALIRTPGRVNLMGVHVDHRGGTVNYITFAREVIMAVRARGDGIVSGRNIDPQFEPFEFSIPERMPEPGRQPWLSFLEGVSVEAGHWSNYIAAPVIRLQDLFPDQKFGGMDIRCGGDIPRGAGVSSSSALVVASLLATRHLESLPLGQAEMVERAGEAEWYVGTRGGMGDHSAILLSEQGRAVAVGFMPLQWNYGKMPERARVILAPSGVSAQKAAGARAAFNQRVAAYELGLLWMRENHPELHAGLERVRDVYPEALGIDLAEIYSCIAELPVAASPQEIENHIQKQKEGLQQVWDFYGRTHDSYPLREVILFGAAECARGRIFGRLLDENRLDEAGRLMAVSHDGDRITRTDPATGESSEYSSSHSDADLAALVNAAKNVDPTAALELQPGGYRCSVPEIDRMVDLLTPLRGVYGAGLTGAGLGGCIVVLCDESAVDDVIDTLNECYYRPNGRDEEIYVCSSVAGACVV